MSDLGYRSYVGDDIVTGEGVSVEVPAASAPARIASGLIDLVLLIILSFALTFAASLIGGSDAITRITGILVTVITFVVTPTLVETLSRGRSLGKLILGLRTVREDGGPITFRHALTRALVGVVEGVALLGAPAILSELIHPRAKRLGDMAAGTYVISQRARLNVVPPPQMPYALEEWARRADIASLPSGLAVGVRQFLARAGGLTPQSRHALGLELLAAVLPYVSPAPPANVHPEYILSAVIAERRRRDLDRLAREHRLVESVLPADRLSSP